MPDTNNEPFCPIYREAREQQPWKNSPTAHRGLVFDKFADAWRQGNGKLEFDKGVERNKGDAGQWLRTMANNLTASSLSEACLRQQQLAKAMGGKTLLLKNASRFVTGLGREHPLENGFAWHHTLGVPYLPGSSLKGMLRAWYREEQGELTDNGKWVEKPHAKELFGSQDAIGRFVLFDMLPTSAPSLAVDVMTPHYGLYYQDDSGQTAPGDWHSPVPISFLVVEEGQTWQLVVVPRAAKQTISQEELDELATMLTDAVAWLGAGAKTAVGYGRFERDQQAEKKARRERERSQQELEQQRARKEKLQGLAPDVAELVTLAEDESWITDRHQNALFLEGVDRYLEQNPEPTSACLHWIRDNCLQLFWKGIWEDPDAMAGKKRDKPKYKSKRARELATRLKDILKSRHA